MDCDMSHGAAGGSPTNPPTRAPSDYATFMMAASGWCFWQALATVLGLVNPLRPDTALGVAQRVADWMIANQHRTDLAYLGGVSFGNFHVGTVNALGGVCVQHQHADRSSMNDILIENLEQLANMVRGVPHLEDFGPDFYVGGDADGVVHSAAELFNVKIAVCDTSGKVLLSYCASTNPNTWVYIITRPE